MGQRDRLGDKGTVVRLCLTGRQTDRVSARFPDWCPEYRFRVFHSDSRSANFSDPTRTVFAETRQQQPPPVIGESLICGAARPRGVSRIGPLRHGLLILM